MTTDASAHDIGVEIAAFLEAHYTVSLATVDAQGHAHAANLLYALDGLALVWTSDPRSRHSRHVETQSAVAATVAPDCNDFAALRGVQIHGHARRIVAQAELDAVRAALRSRYPFLDRLAQGPQAMQQAWRDGGFYRLQPTRLTLIDNSRGFGHKTSVSVGADGALAVFRADPN